MWFGSWFRRRKKKKKKEIKRGLKVLNKLRFQREKREKGDEEKLL
jgi:hypothetical protein